MYGSTNLDRNHNDDQLIILYSFHHRNIFHSFNSNFEVVLVLHCLIIVSIYDT